MFVFEKTPVNVQQKSPEGPYLPPRNINRSVFG